MEERKKSPSLPSNYVSLGQLRERWLKEQERKQSEREQEEERKLREKEEQEQERDDQQIQRRNLNGERSEANSVVISRRPYGRNGRIRPEKDRRTIEVIKPRSKETRIEVHNEEQNPDESKKKKKKKKFVKNRKPRAGKDRTGDTVQLVPENEPKETIPIVVTEGIRENVMIRAEFPQNGNNLGVNRKVGERKVPVDQTAEIEKRFENLLLNGGKESILTSRAEMNGGHRSYGGYGRFNHQKLWKQGHHNLVWVKKEEVAYTNVAEIRSSGSLVEAGEGKRKN